MLDTGDGDPIYGQAWIWRVDPRLLVCDFVTVDALELLKIDRDFLPVWGTFGIENERGLGGSRHLSVN